MKSLIKKFADTELGILLRNSFNFKPVYLNIPQKNYFATVSDAFLWRTDNGYKTIFKYSDILNLFYKIKNSWVEFHFYSKNNKLIKIEKKKSLSLSNQFEITSKYFNTLEDYGTFYIYHFTKKTSHLDINNIISNRCYLGYSKNNNLYSFVHGNTLAKIRSINSKANVRTDIVKTSLFKNHIYTIQKYFNDFDKTELFFINPSSKIIKFSLEKKSFELKPHCTLLIEVTNSIISIKSNCLFLRPTVFSYKGQYVDVHHS